MDFVYALNNFLILALLIFLLFHMCANLMILNDDGGAAYGALCHFMGSNIVV